MSVEVAALTRIDADSRRRLLVAALGFLQLEPRAPELRALHAWLSTWAGIGHVVTGMERQGYVMSLRRIWEDGWAATFDRHPMFAPDGFATAVTPWEAAGGVEVLQSDGGEPVSAQMSQARGKKCPTVGASREHGTPGQRPLFKG